LDIDIDKEIGARERVLFLAPEKFFFLGVLAIKLVILTFPI
jgi:hypothetical protein